MYKRQVWENYFLRRTTLAERLMLLVCAFLLFMPGHLWDIGGLALFALVYAMQRFNLSASGKAA